MLSKKVEYAQIKNSVFPRILHVLENSPQVALKVKCLETIQEFLGSLDRTTVSGTLLKSL